MTTIGELTASLARYPSHSRITKIWTECGRVRVRVKRPKNRPEPQAGPLLRSVNFLLPGVFGLVCAGLCWLNPAGARGPLLDLECLLDLG
jgi:hypothetical protein